MACQDSLAPEIVNRAFTGSYLKGYQIEKSKTSLVLLIPIQEEK